MAVSSRRDGRENARRVDEHHLQPSRMVMPITRRRVVCTLGETIDTLAADQSVEQGRLADIGRADDGHEAGARWVTGSAMVFAGHLLQHQRGRRLLGGPLGGGGGRHGRLVRAD